MSTFAVSTQGGLIPSERVIRVRPPTAESFGSQLEYAADGGQQATAQTPIPITPVDFLPVIAATPGYELLEPFDDPEAPEGIAVDRTPIVAWRIDGQSALPVTPLDAPPSDHTAILTPSGAVIAPDQWFESLELYKQFQAR
ncbi:MAG: hypothetical protein ACLFSI_08150 [Halorhodospira sp.]